jgi:16S rRNA (guanine527-N7)-methyltransferase
MPIDIPTRLNQLLEASQSPPLDPTQAEKFTAYLTLLQKWNTRTNLTAIRDEESILSRHFVESIFCARVLPSEVKTLLDYGSGAGFPGIPISIIKKDLGVILAESQNKKAAFLREAIRTLDLAAKVHSARAETLQQKFDCVTLRAVDNMPQALHTAINLLAPAGYLALLTTTPEFAKAKSSVELLQWHPPIPLPNSTERILVLGRNSQ